MSSRTTRGGPAGRKPTTADLVVLSLLAETPMHGYQLVSELERRDARDWAQVSRPQVYYSIQKLHDLKLIRAAADPDGSLGPERTRFEITPVGLESLNQALADPSWAGHRPPPPFLTWMALSTHLPKRESARVIGARKRFLACEIERERATLQSMEKENEPMTQAARLMVGLTIELFEAELVWLSKAGETLASVRN